MTIYIKRVKVYTLNFYFNTIAETVRSSEQYSEVNTSGTTGEKESNFSYTIIVALIAFLIIGGLILFAIAQNNTNKTDPSNTTTKETDITKDESLIPSYPDLGL